MPVTEPQKSCAQNWVQYKNSCYLFATNRFSWNGAKAHCEFLGSNLIEIYSSDENNFIKEYIRKKVLRVFRLIGLVVLTYKKRALLNG